MLWKTHALTGALLGFWLFKNDLLVTILFLVIGSLTPDIDSSKSLLGRFLKPASLLMKHRGFLHSLTGMTLLTVLLKTILGSYAALPFLSGYASHLFLDSLTREGLRPFYPSKSWLKGPFKTGGLSEKVFLAILAGLTLAKALL